MKILDSELEKMVLLAVIMMVLLSGFSGYANGTGAHKIRANTEVKHLVINEFYSNATKNQMEWVELYNKDNGYAHYTDLHLSDQDGHVVNISADYGITSIPPDSYILIYFGRGVNDTSFTNNNNDNKVVLYTWKIRGNVLNDGGDDLLLYNGTYGTSGCQYLDYIAYFTGGTDIDLDLPPAGSGLKFDLNGRGAYGFIPAPKVDESVSLVPNGDDNDEASDWYVTRYINTTYRYDNSITPGLHNANILEVHIEDIAPVNQTQGTERAVIKYTMDALGGNVEIYKTFVDLYGTINDEEIQSGMYQDNGDGNWDVGDQAVITGYATYSGHATSFSTPNIYVQVLRPKTFFITVKLADDASIFHNYSLRLRDMDTGTWSDNKHTNEVYIVNSVQTKYVKISPIDQVSPYVTNVSFDGGTKKPLGPGIHNVTIAFDEPMDTSIAPNVTYGIYGDEYHINGTWITNKMWAGDFIVNNRGPHGILTLHVRDAKDVFWNVLVPYNTSFYVDTTKPFVEDIKYSAVSPYPGFFPVTVTLFFSENVSSVVAMIKQGKNVIYVANVSKINSTVYTLQFNTQSWETGNYTLWIYNATDIAGNVMDDFETNFTVDTSVPMISYVDYKMSVVEGENVSFLVYATDNVGVKKVWAVYEYKGEKVTVEATRMGDYWGFQVVGGAVTPGTVDVTIYVQDEAGNVFKDEESITVIPWWHAMWWLWVIIAIIVGFIVLLIYDTIRRRKLREQLGEELVSESLLVRISKIPKNLKKKKKKPEGEEEEEEEEEAPSYMSMPPPPREAPPPAPPPVQEAEEPGSKEIPEVPYEEEYFDEETIEREE